MNKVKEYHRRRLQRMQKRFDANKDKGRWVTTEEGHKVHLNEEGVPDKGNPKVIDRMTNGGASIQNSEKSSISESSSSAKRFNDEVEKVRKEKGAVFAGIKASDLIDDMEVGSIVECKNYKTGEVMAFRKNSNNNSIIAYTNINGKNHHASPEHVKSWLRESIVYADYTPVFR